MTVWLGAACVAILIATMMMVGSPNLPAGYCGPDYREAANGRGVESLLP